MCMNKLDDKNSYMITWFVYIFMEFEVRYFWNHFWLWRYFRFFQHLWEWKLYCYFSEIIPVTCWTIVVFVILKYSVCSRARPIRVSPTGPLQFRNFLCETLISGWKQPEISLKKFQVGSREVCFRDLLSKIQSISSYLPYSFWVFNRKNVHFKYWFC